MEVHGIRCLFQVDRLKHIEKTRRMPPGVYFNVDKEAFDDFFRRVFSMCFGQFKTHRMVRLG